MDRNDDPLSRAMVPPPDETPGQRTQRICQEDEAVRISRGIDLELQREQAEKKKHRPEIKVLLLGMFLSVLTLFNMLTVGPKVPQDLESRQL